MKYAFIRDHRFEFSVRAMCRVLGVHASGFDLRPNFLPVFGRVI